MIQGKIMDSAMNENMADEASDTGVRINLEVLIYIYNCEFY